MSLLHEKSLASTVDAVNEAFLFGHPPKRSERAAAARWLAGRIGLKSEERFYAGSYRGMCAPTKADFAMPFRLFTGEWVTTKAGTAHILGQESCRALQLLDAGKECRDALLHARKWMTGPKVIRHGMYCCATCSAALWRHLAVSDMRGAEGHIAAGLRELKNRRSSDGTWRSFPFNYTLLALIDVDMKAAREEIRHAAPRLEKIAKRANRGDKYAKRRQFVAEKALSM